MENYNTLAEALKAKNNGLFVNSNGEYCNVSRFYIKNTFWIDTDHRFNHGHPCHPFYFFAGRVNYLQTVGYSCENNVGLRCLNRKILY